jgi:hypothetical protein
MIASVPEDRSRVSATRVWHAKLFDAMVALDRGDVEGAGAARTTAYEFGVRSGIAEAFHARLYGDFLACWLGGDTDGLAELAHRRPSGRGEATPLLGRAGLACATAVFGELDAGIAQAVEVASKVIETPRSQGAAALAIVSGLLAKSEATPVIRAAFDHLSSRAGSMLVVGAFAGSLGPVDRYLARLRTGQDRIDDLHRALATAQAIGSPLWTATVLADLADAGDRTAAERRRGVVGDTGLASLPRFSGGTGTGPTT